MKQGSPSRGELVVCRITKLYPNSAFAQLLEYDKPGMIHVSEVASRWVRNIKEFLKEKQYVVCKVVGIDERGISLTIKRVRREEAARKMNEFKRERKAESMLEQVAKSIKKTKEQAWDEAGHVLQEEFGSLTKAFDVAVRNPGLLTKKGLPSEWAKPMIEMAGKRFAGKSYQLRGNLELVCYKPDGVNIIRNILIATRKRGFAVSYVSAPRYTLTGEGKDIRKLKTAIQEEGESIVKAVESEGGEGMFSLVDE